MEELYAERLATHGGPESCVDRPRRRSVGRGTRRRGEGAAKFRSFGVPTLLAHAEGDIAGSVIREFSGTLRGRGTRHARSLRAREPGDRMAARLGDGRAARSGKTEVVWLSCTVIRSQPGR